VAEYGPRIGRRKAIGLIGLTLLMTKAGAATPSTPIRLLVLGDSLTAGYGLPHQDGFQAQLQTALAKAGDNVKILDAAVSGDTSTGGRARLEWALSDGADAALVELGANDGLRGTDPATMDANLTAILDTLKSRHIPTLLSGMYAPPNLGQEYFTKFREVFDRLSRRSGLLYDPFFLDGVVGSPSLIQADGLHPNAAGVKIIVKRILPLVEKLLAQASGLREAPAP
jgi:acyl-CoA thioesterase-1